MSVRIIHGDCRDVLPTLPSESFDCIVTSPPYWGLRDYGVAGQIGLEPTPEDYVSVMVGVFREVRRILRSDGTLWLNLGDSYASRPNGSIGATRLDGSTAPHAEARRANSLRKSSLPPGLKHKDLIGVPWRVAFALQAEGWYLRSDIIWHKPNPMPESVTDRPTSAHEYVFLFSKSERYFYDADAIREPPSEALIKQIGQGYDGADTKDYASGAAQSASGTKRRIIENARKKIDKQRGHGRRHQGFNDRWDALKKDEQMAVGSNARNVWTIATRPFKEAHFATFPPELAERCIKAGCPAGGSVLDPFGGAGTTGLVADQLGRSATLIELNQAYRDMAARRIEGDAPLFAEVSP